MATVINNGPGEISASAALGAWAAHAQEKMVEYAKAGGLTDDAVDEALAIINQEDDDHADQ